jgi:hypothetical protein
MLLRDKDSNIWPSVKLSSALTAELTYTVLGLQIHIS